MNKRIVKVNRHSLDLICRMSDEEFLEQKNIKENPHLKEGFLGNEKQVTYCEDRDYIYARIPQQSLIKRAF